MYAFKCPYTERKTYRHIFFSFFTCENILIEWNMLTESKDSLLLTLMQTNSNCWPPYWRLDICCKKSVQTVTGCHSRSSHRSNCHIIIKPAIIFILEQPQHVHKVTELDRGIFTLLSLHYFWSSHKHFKEQGVYDGVQHIRHFLLLFIHRLFLGELSSAESGKDILNYL